MLSPRHGAADMVTRNGKGNFAVGEKVLCYEPDPTKAKVLYDSKVLDVIVKGNKRGRKQIEYLIHFHRWNHTWDRCVPEELVLKDTVENRLLQKELHEKSQQQLKLNRRKAVLNATGQSQPGQSVFDDYDNSNPFPEMPDEMELTSSSDSDADDEAGVGEYAEHPHLGIHEYPKFRAHIEIPPRVKDFLSMDYRLVREQGRLHKLPAEPCVSEILEMAVRDAARSEAAMAAALAGRKTSATAGYSLRGPRKPAPTQPNETIIDLSRRLNLIHEVADGLRIYFDYILGTHLVYKEENAQFLNCDSLRRNERMEMEMRLFNTLAAKTASALNGGSSSGQPLSPHEGQDNGCEDSSRPALTDQHTDGAEVSRGTKREIGSPQLGRSPKRIRDDKPRVAPTAPLQNGKSIEATEEPCKSSTEARRAAKSEISASLKTEITVNTDHEPRKKENGPMSPILEGVRRLRSYKTIATPERIEENVEPEIIAEKSSEKTREASPEKGVPFASPMRSPYPEPEQRSDSILGPVLDMGSAAVTLNEKISNWRIIPDEGCGFYPCKIYGATHLARLFVKLPDFLNATKMDEQKLKSLLQRFQIFTDFLEDHPEWFGEGHYFEMPPSATEQSVEEVASPVL